MTVVLRIVTAPTPPAPPLRRRRPGLLRRLFTGRTRDGMLRAGAERPAAPMLASISLGGASRMR